MMQAGLVVGDVELVGHDLPERRAGALAAVGLADVERRGVVLADDDPRIELPEVEIGIRTGSLRRSTRRRERTARPPTAPTLTTSRPERLEEISARGVPFCCLQHVFDVFRDRS